MTKKILLTIGILIIVGVVVFLVFDSASPLNPGDTNGFSIRDYLPFGSSNDLQISTTTENEGGSGLEITNTTVNQSVPRLRKISNEPVAGTVIFDIGTTSVVRFVEKGTGNVYETQSDTKTVTRLTNTTIPKIIRAFWLPNGSGFLAQTLIPGSEIVETNLVKLNKNTATSSNEILTPFSTTINKLPTDIKEISIKPDGTKIFYYTINGLSSNWFISNPDGTGSSLMMSHPLTEWLPKWISSNSITMQNKSSSDIIGYVYSFNTSNKILKKIGIGTNGISSIVNPDESFSLVSSGGNLPQLFLVNNQNSSSKKITFNGLADKCIWLKSKNPTVYCAIPNEIPNGNYPDIWYKGLVSTDDIIEKIDLDNDIFYNISNLSSESGQKIDVFNLSLSPNETHLIFQNKIDGYLWMLRIDKD